MPYRLKKWPQSVYPKEAAELPEAAAHIDAALRALVRLGPMREEYGAKNLGQSKEGLWQLGFKVNRKQIRILYAPYKHDIVIYCIHPKTSPQEQDRAYERAMRRKREAERILKQTGDGSDGLPDITFH